MPVDKSLLAGSTALMLVKLLAEQDMYGYQMAEELKRRSENVFVLKAGTMYPLLHTLESKGLVRSYMAQAQGRERRYYAITEEGKKYLAEREGEWLHFTSAVARVLKGGALYGV